MQRSALRLAMLVLGLAVRPGCAAESGQAIFQGACAACHAAGSPRVLSGQKLLSRTKAITESDPAPAIRLILHGKQPAPEQRGPWMPAYADVLSDAQIADVLAWLRQRTTEPPWPDLAVRVHALRASAAEAK